MLLCLENTQYCGEVSNMLQLNYLITEKLKKHYEPTVFLLRSEIMYQPLRKLFSTIPVQPEVRNSNSMWFRLRKPFTKNCSSYDFFVKH